MSNPESVNDLGYINMPDADPAHDTLPHIEEALAAPAEPSGNSGEFAAPAGEQVGLTNREMPILPPVEEGGFGNGPFRYTDQQMLAYGRAAIAAHEAKKAGGGV